uniref:Uncharacterized protein n=1 Tax=Rhizophagus irregularis (strain DAOM 181602 / DAOM 197198 / MUCL 43194) TaxID=747089 RepID=U9T087_RHIID
MIFIYATFYDQKNVVQAELRHVKLEQIKQIKRNTNYSKLVYLFFWAYQRIVSFRHNQHIFLDNIDVLIVLLFEFGIFFSLLQLFGQRSKKFSTRSDSKNANVFNNMVQKIISFD